MANDVTDVARPTPAVPVSVGTIFRTFLKAGLSSFGGGAIAYERDYLVNDNKWLDDEGFLSALEISQALPGLKAVNLGVIVGDQLAGTLGAIAAVLGFVLPGAFVIMVLGAEWGARENDPNLRAFLIGVASAAVGLLSTVTLQLGHKQFVNPLDLGIILMSFFAVSFLHVPLYLVLLVIGPVAVCLYMGGADARAIEERARQLRQQLRHRHVMYIRD
jgi:chromate transporter